MCVKEHVNQRVVDPMDSRLSRFGDLPAVVSEAITSQRDLMVDRACELYKERGADAIFVLFFLLVDPPSIQERPLSFSTNLDVPPNLSLQLANGRDAYAASQKQGGNGRGEMGVEAEVELYMADEEVVLRHPKGEVEKVWNWHGGAGTKRLSFRGEDVRSVFAIDYDGSTLEARHQVVVPVFDGDKQVGDLNIPVSVVKLPDESVLEFEPMSGDCRSDLSSILQYFQT